MNSYSKILKSASLSVLVLFSMNICILPSLSAVTVEEQAGRKNKDSASYNEDEFLRKTPARKGYSGSTEEKDPRLACLLSLIIPGGGEIYLKNDLKGIAFFSLSVTGYSAAGYYLYKGIFGDAEGAEKKSRLVLSGLFYLLGLVFHTVGVVESYNDAIEINEKSFYYGGYSLTPYVAKISEK